MQTQWDLSGLYAGFDDPAFLQDMEKFRQKAKEMVELSEKLETFEPLEALCRGTQLLEDLAVLEDRLPRYPHLRICSNSGDTEAVSWQGKIQAVSASATGAQAAFKLWAGKLPQLAELVECDPLLQQYRFYYSQLAQSCRYLLSGEQEALLATMNLSGRIAWNQMRGAVTSQVKATYRGKSMTLSGVRNLARDADPQVRREAFEAELACYEMVKAPVAHAMNAIKQATIAECRMRGYDSVLDWSLKQAKMRKETLDAMFAAVEDYLPRLRRYLKAKAKLLGHENGLPWYDLYAPVGKGSRTFTPEEASEHLVALFRGFDAEMATMMETAFRDAWVDFYPRPGKRDGAFCSSSRSLGRSWVHTNYSGKLASVSTLAHELGHAFHNICIREHRPLNKSYGRPISETASTFNECLVYDAAIQTATEPQEELNLIEACLVSDAILILDIYSRYLFEDEVIRRRENEFLDADELCRIMARAQEAAFGDGLDGDWLHPYMWICKPHYYSAFYYNYPYIFGGLLSRGLYACYKDEGEAFVPKYKKLLYTTTVATLEDAAAVADIDLTQKKFWLRALEGIDRMIDRFCELVEE